MLVNRNVTMAIKKSFIIYLFLCRQKKKLKVQIIDYENKKYFLKIFLSNLALMESEKKYKEALKKKVLHETNSSDAEEISEELEVSLIIVSINTLFIVSNIIITII